MEHIKNNNREINQKSHWQTDDPNIVVELQTVSVEIHLDKLRAKITQLEMELASSQPIEVPEELKTALAQQMADTLNDGGETFQKIVDAVESQNTRETSDIQAELDKLNVLLAEVTQ